MPPPIPRPSFEEGSGPEAVPLRRLPLSQEMMGAVVKSRAEAGAGWKRAPVPQAGPDGVLIEVRATPICGKDLQIDPGTSGPTAASASPRTWATRPPPRWWRSGRPSAIARGFQVPTPGGCVSLLELSHGPVRIDLNDGVIMKGTWIYGITGRKILNTWHKSSGLRASGLLDLKPLLTHRLPATRFATSMDLLRKGECGNIVLLPAD